MASKRKPKRKPHNLVPRELTVKLQLRLPKTLHRELKRAAAGKCSLNAEMLRRLQLQPGVGATTLTEFIELLRADIHGQQTQARPTAKERPTLQIRQPETEA